MAGVTTKDKLLQMLEEQQGSFVSGELLANQLSISRNAVWKAAQALRNQGYDIRAVTNRGYQLVRSGSAVSAEDILRRLPRNAPFDIVAIPRVKSTNSEAQRLALAGAVEGTVVVAGEQTAGRGRHGRSFYSPSGTGLYLSVVLRPVLAADKGQALTTMGAVACATAIEELTGCEASIKWVNDVFCGGRKVGGILTEARMDIESGCLDYVVLGVGVNVCRPRGGFPSELESVAGFVSDCDIRAELAASFLSNFWRLYRQLPACAHWQEYRDRCFVLGQSVVVSRDGRKIRGRALDITPEFELVVGLPNDEQVVYRYGEVV